MAPPVKQDILPWAVCRARLAGPCVCWLPSRRRQGGRSLCLSVHIVSWSLLSGSNDVCGHTEYTYMRCCNVPLIHVMSAKPRCHGGAAPSGTASLPSSGCCSTCLPSLAALPASIFCLRAATALNTASKAAGAGPIGVPAGAAAGSAGAAAASAPAVGTCACAAQAGPLPPLPGSCA